MRNFQRLTLSLVLCTVGLAAACGDDKNDTDNNETGTAAPSTMTDPPPATGTDTDGPTTVTPTTEGPVDPTTEGPVDPTTEGPVDPNGFVFDATPPESLVQRDRMGMPAVATAVISAELKDMYNEASPEQDAMSAFVPDIVKNVTAIHAALDDDLQGAGLTPCAVDVCAMQAGPLVVPDTLQIDVSLPPGFPNGRQLADPVIDVTLAVVLLDLTKHPADTLAKLPLNPPKNDKDFLPDFPYVATPN